MKKLEKIRIALLYLFFGFLICFLIFIKKDYHIDELGNFNLANQSTYLSPEEGQIYIPSDQPYMDAMASDGTFNLENVWERQSKDTHPPFYYSLLHLICVFFPGKISKYYSGVINVLFALLSLYYYRKTLNVLIDDDNIVLVYSVAFCLSAGILQIATFLRMYVMAMCLVTVVTYLIVKKIDHYDFKDFLKLFFASFIGALTHYYFIVYLFFISIVACLIMINQKRIKELLGYCFTMACSGITTILIFPPILTCLFKGNRGAESIKNISKLNLGERLESYLKILNPFLFGKMLTSILLFIGILLLLDLIKTDNENNKLITHIKRNKLHQYLCIIIPAFCYLLFVAKTAPYVVDRYISPIYAISIGGVWGLVYECFKNVYGKIHVRNSIIIGFISVVTIAGLANCKWSYLYLDRSERLDNSRIYGWNSEAIVLYDVTWKIYPSYLEIKNCDSSIYYKTTSYQKFKELNQKELPDDIAFFIFSENHEQFLNEFLSDNTQYSIALDNGEYGFCHAYYLKNN